MFPTTYCAMTLDLTAEHGIERISNVHQNVCNCQEDDQKSQLRL
jgi:hypothetical protein